ncbi:raffinose/stachyose/melibiose transport system permease protein [Amycolatopsis bartoniae]|uniref:Sugar ABC transporter permease n=1 Tax=Amycolatopsis bartoniae TaxID=941986 RepID=A0A8H9IMP8_9PSEU|nr:carbohydrate ABC transporter permease [Amycolatopsis bartoniae]MBB2938378.1 raffinose/stachyose/melibiose transport system permease protein [Amycolatopsis bartoniae]TVT10218.1 carbohydrate ABC transporter permease [Amycolatopsis bartoniae]GHF34750.1 sugar ABC transporter permease [Amycolatopsis bartoniae]
MSRLRYRPRTFAREIVMLVAAAIWWVPFYLIVALSLQDDDAVQHRSLALPITHPQLSNFSDAWSDPTNGMGHGLLSSLIITGGSVVVIVVLASLGAYAIARHAGRLSNGLYVTFVIGIVLPYQLGLIPAFVALRELGLVGTYLGMILLYTGLEMPTAIFLYAGFIRALPRDYEEAALVDGATPLRIFWRVVFPLLAPVTATVAVVTALFVWNDFFAQLVFLGGTANQTLPVAIYGFVGEFSTQWNYVFAGVVLSVLPVLAFFVLTQRKLVKGFTGGIK